MPRNPSQILKHPVAGFRGKTGNQWKISLLVMTAPKEALALKVQAPGKSSKPIKITENGGRVLWRYDINITLKDGSQSLAYHFRGQDYSIEIPGKREPARMAYASCNGFSDPKLIKDIADPFSRWTDLWQKHQEKPFHYFLMGGDQIYSDSIWQEIPKLKEWVLLKEAKMTAEPWTESLRTDVANFYFNLYSERWSVEPVGTVLAQIPTIMMWDDHDIFDGWGSYPDDRHYCPVYQGIFKEADKAFRWFQLQVDDRTQLPESLNISTSYTQGFQIGDLAIAVLDLRSERRLTRVLSEETWKQVYNWVDGLTGCKHLLIMSSIPVVYPDFAALENLLGFIPGQDELEDDLKDHWCSRSHQAERLRMIHRLLSFSQDRTCRVTILSGDVHVAALGILESHRKEVGNSQVINQLIASGIIHPPPPAVALVAVKLLGKKVEEADRGIKAWMATFPGTDVTFIPCRNWMSISGDDKSRLWAEWHTEEKNLGDPYCKVIHSCG
jgi:hypothetical protein